MIRDVVEAAKGKKGSSPPPRLVFAWRCKEYHALPRSGAMGDQEYREIYLNDVLPRLYDVVQRWRSGGATNLSESDRTVITWLAKIGMM